LILGTTACLAQDDDAAAIRREHWTAGVLASYGNGLFDRTNIHFVRAGVRVGRVMTGELGPGWARGTFELDSEVMPAEFVLWGGYKNVYALGVNPLVMKWNFTRGRKLIPYFLAQGGMLWSADRIPPGDTSKINFTSGAGVGLNYFVKPRRSVNFDFRATHLSNASLGDHNPGVNASLQWSVGYNWWKQ
jgi:hypothetical protein